jgi:fumarylacetoacetate (FAA) hydrolase
VKVASIRDGSRDGKLVVVSRDLSQYAPATDIAPTLQAALDDWRTAAPLLEQRSRQLEAGEVLGSAFASAEYAAPLPRAFAFLDGSAFASHGELMGRALGIPPDAHPPGVILMYQGLSDAFLGPHDDIIQMREDDGIDFEMEIGVIVDDVQMGISAAEAASHIQLVVLLNDVSLRTLAPLEMKTGFGFISSKPASSFAPVAVSPTELGDAWIDQRLHLPVRVAWNGTLFGQPDAGAMASSFADLIARAAQTRRLSAGTIIGSGTVSNSSYATVGSGCIAELRSIEILESGHAITPYMRFGDRVRIEVLDRKGNSIFGAIDQYVVPRRNTAGGVPSDIAADTDK